MTLIDQLTTVFNSNFVAYYRSHVAHVNTQGRNFYSDHKLLQKIYEDLQSNIDTIAEFLRTLDEPMPTSLDAVLRGSDIADQDQTGSADQLLTSVAGDVVDLVGLHRDLMRAATESDQDQIANYAQDRITTLERFLWMLRSTLSE
jgi:starvation-inducible DNA-binding protein